MPLLKSQPSLKDIQNYVIKLEKERGFYKNDLNKEIFLLEEEIGEFLKAIRKKTRIKADHDPKFGSVDEELADILFHLCAIANRFNIDLDQAFRNKEKINSKRIRK